MKSQGEIRGIDGWREAAMRFAIWMTGRHSLPSIQEVRDYLHCSRATAYRWIRAWKDANGHA